MTGDLCLKCKEFLIDTNYHCDCKDCLEELKHNPDSLCHFDCLVNGYDNPCQGCQEAQEALLDAKFDIDQARGIH